MGFLYFIQNKMHPYLKVEEELHYRENGCLERHIIRQFGYPAKVYRNFSKT